MTSSLCSAGQRALTRARIIILNHANTPRINTTHHTLAIPLSAVWLWPAMFADKLPLTIRENSLPCLVCLVCWLVGLQRRRQHRWLHRGRSCRTLAAAAYCSGRTRRFEFDLCKHISVARIFGRRWATIIAVGEPQLLASGLNQGMNTCNSAHPK
jgi:hypothetical protein